MKPLDTCCRCTWGLGLGSYVECDAKASDCRPRKQHGVWEYTKAAKFDSGCYRTLLRVILFSGQGPSQQEPSYQTYTPPRPVLLPPFRTSAVAPRASMATGPYPPGATLPPSTTTKLPHRHGGRLGGTGMQRVPAGAGGKPARRGGERPDHAPAWYEQLIKGGGKVSYPWVQ